MFSNLLLLPPFWVLTRAVLSYLSVPFRTADNFLPSSTLERWLHLLPGTGHFRIFSSRVVTRVWVPVGALFWSREIDVIFSVQTVSGCRSLFKTILRILV